MSTLDDLCKLTEPEDYCRPIEKESLLSKYRIPIQNFEPEYIEKCRDSKELERILQVLKSGEEGYFPHLIEQAEERLMTIKPKSKLLRKVVPVTAKNDLDKKEMNEIYEDLGNWMIDVSKHNKELEKRKVNTVECDAKIREYKETYCEDKGKSNADKRIQSTDYSAWDKYDPDTEILKMELEEQNKKKAAVKHKPKKTVQKGVTFNKFGTEAEAAFMATHEKEKGNEFFKAGDYEEAFHCYTRSILAKPSIDNLNNRAATYIKLKKFRNAIGDCDKVLVMNSGNVKAYLRKAEALEKLELYEEAIECVDFVIRKDPNNVVAQEIADSIRKKFQSNLKKTRMKIVEIE